LRNKLTYLFMGILIIGMFLAVVLTNAEEDSNAADPAVLNQTGQAYYEEGDYENAAVCFEKAGNQEELKKCYIASAKYYIKFKPLSLTTQNPVYGVAASADHKYLATVDHTNQVMLWSLRSGSTLKSLEADEKLDDLAFSSDNRYLIGCSEKNVYRWDLQNGGPVYIYKKGWVNDDYSSVIISPDDKYVIASGFGSAEVWELAGGNRKGRYGYYGWPNTDSIAITNDDKCLAFCRDGDIIVWSMEKGKLKTIEGAFNVLALTHDNKCIVAGDKNNNVTIWDFQTGTLVRSITGHQDSVTSVTVSKDDQFIISGSKDKTVKIWNFQTGALIQTLEGHQDEVLSVAVSNDGQFAVSGGRDKCARIWLLWDQIKVAEEYAQKAGVTMPELYGEFAGEEFAKGNYELAADFYGKANDQKMQQECYRKLADQAFKNGEYDVALDYYKKIGDSVKATECQKLIVPVLAPIPVDLSKTYKTYTTLYDAFGNPIPSLSYSVFSADDQLIYRMYENSIVAVFHFKNTGLQGKVKFTFTINAGDKVLNSIVKEFSLEKKSAYQVSVTIAYKDYKNNLSTKAVTLANPAKIKEKRFVKLPPDARLTKLEIERLGSI
jgi:tetratricopeptide (TPR) repeat protein